MLAMFMFMFMFIALIAAGLDCMECSSMLCSINDEDVWNPMPPGKATLVLEILELASIDVGMLVPVTAAGLDNWFHRNELWWWLLLLWLLLFWIILLW